MEIKFNKSACPCLRLLASECKTQEQTQEVRLPDSLPDIGRVLGCWGQVLVRSKEWRGSSMSISGGVMAWALYAPEDGSAPRSVDAWIPFQIRWDLPDTQRDGSIIAVPQIKGMDARSISARKLMLRANVSIMGQALEPTEAEIYAPQEVPRDVQLLKVSYPVELPQEAGEKLFQVDEELTLPGNYPPVENILRYEAMPKIMEQKVMAGRLVFRGTCNIHLLYESGGAVYSWDMELPFSQYAELDHDRSNDAGCDVTLMLTGLELSMAEEQKMAFKCGMAAQYVVYDRQMLELVEDAYSPHRQVKVTAENLELPICLERMEHAEQVEATGEMEAERIADICWMPEHPSYSQSEDVLEFSYPGQFSMLYYDREGNLQSAVIRGESTSEIPSDAHNRTVSRICGVQPPQGTITPQNGQLTAEFTVHTSVFTSRGLPMVTELTVGEAVQPEPERPSLILRRAGDDRLWDIAKSCGSTVDAICKANDLQAEPEHDRMLIIPIA